MGLAITENIRFKPEKSIPVKKLKATKIKLTAQDKELINHLKALKWELDAVQLSFDYTTDPTLIDSFIFENMAINMRYKYYLEKCKERGLMAF